MKILQVSTYNIRGGAAIAMYRLHRAARMEQIFEFTRMLREAEADRAQLNRQVLELNPHWTVEVRRRLSSLIRRNRIIPPAANHQGSTRK